MILPQPIRDLIDHLSELPSIGPRQATRLAFYLLGEGRGAVKHLSLTLAELLKVKVCARCFFIHQNSDEFCGICRDPNRDQLTVLITEKETDLISLEKTGRYRGRYFLIGEIPRTGVLENWQKDRLGVLKKDLQTAGQAKEVILGFNPTAIGDFHAAILKKELDGLAEKISRLGRGLPTGGEIEFADDETLGASLERRS